MKSSIKFVLLLQTQISSIVCVFLSAFYFQQSIYTRAWNPQMNG